MTQRDIKLIAESTPLKSLHESPTNPRKIPAKAVEVVAASIERFGWKQPVVATRDGEILAGHTRVRAARKLGYTHVPVLIADDLSAEEARAYRIADNRSADFASWDMPLLVDELEGLADCFADELALEDWDALMAEYDAVVNELAVVQQSNGQDTAPDALNAGQSDEAADQVAVPGTYALGAVDESGGNLPQDVQDEMQITLVGVTVWCESEEVCQQIVRQVMDMPGVVDIKRKRG